MGLATAKLPSFPWDALEPYRRQAMAAPGGLVDLSVGTPVDPTPQVLQEALIAHANAPGYPPTVGTTQLRQAIVDHYRRRRQVDTLLPDAVLPTIGSKEAVGLLPALLGLGQGDVVVHPAVAYPTYGLGATLAGATALPLALDGPANLQAVAATQPELAESIKLIWLNTPANPHGEVTSQSQLAGIVKWARRHGAVVASDECYAELPWEEPYLSQGVPCLLDRRVNQGNLEGLLALYSLSKQSNAAGYRAAWLAGDPDLIGRLSLARKHIGMMVPAPVQGAMVAALSDDVHLASQRARYAKRRAVLVRALSQSGYVIDGSKAGLYLWVSTEAGWDAWDLVGRFAKVGVLVAPGYFYGSGGSKHVRMALTCTDAAIERAQDAIAAS